MLTKPRLRFIVSNQLLTSLFTILERDVVRNPFALVPIDSSVSESLFDALTDLLSSLLAARASFASFRVVASIPAVFRIVDKSVVLCDQLDFKVDGALSIPECCNDDAV